MSSESDLTFFALLARQGNLTSAAREMGVTPGAASKRLNQLEGRLGVRLAQRTTRSMSLTEEGEAYLAHAQRILADIEAAEQEVGAARIRPRGQLRVNATFGFGRRYIVPAIAAFLKRHEEISVQLQLTDQPMDLAESGFDLGVRVGELGDTAMIARRLAPNRKYLVASPRYLERFGVPTKPADLSSHQCLLIRENTRAYALWRLGSGRSAATVRVKGPLSSNDGEAVHQWALAGHGIIIRSEWDIAADLRSGKLVEVLPQWPPAPADVYAVYPERHQVSSRVRVFIDFLADYFGESPPWRRPP